MRVLTNPGNEALPTLRLMQKDPKTLAAIRSTLDNDWEDLFAVHLALEASSSSTTTSDNPTAFTADEETQETLQKCTEEVKRANGGELHNISSVTGGMVAQEAIKLLTKQYVPVDGVCVFDGVRSKVGVFKV